MILVHQEIKSTEVSKMGRGLPKKVKSLLEKSREAALLAVEVYNKPNTTFRTGVYIILMNIAWTSLFHAIFER